jgi:hypothetical protein
MTPGAVRTGVRYGVRNGVRTGVRNGVRIATARGSIEALACWHRAARGSLTSIAPQGDERE